jgi:hypothetical protein
MADERYPSALNIIFGHDAHEFHYSKVDRIGRNITISVKLSSWAKSLKICR